MNKTLLLLLLLPFVCAGQVWEDFSAGNLNSWLGDTSDFKITSSSAVPPEMKPALQSNGTGSDTSYLVIPNTAMDETEWSFWIKLSFNSSANNFARVYLVSDSPYLEGPLNGYFVAVGGANDSIGLCRQTGTEVEYIIKSIYGFTGNSTNILRIRTTRDSQGNWALFTDNTGGFEFVAEGTATDNTWQTTQYFGLSCRYTSSNAQKFYFDELYAGELITDTIPPELLNIYTVSENSLQILFNEEVTAASASDTANYTVDSGLGHPFQAERDPGNHSRVNISFAKNFAPSAVYDLMAEGICDKYGNCMPQSHAGFFYNPPSPVMPCNVVINEIMTDVNPVPSGLPEAEYIELLNRTSDTIDLAGWKIFPRISGSAVTIPGFAILPDSFLLLVHEQHVNDFSGCGPVCGLSSFSMNNEGAVFLSDPAGSLISSLCYDTDSYGDDNKSNGGWSLEQVDPFNPCLGALNWKASVAEEGGTPGRRNSVSAQIPVMPEIADVYVPDAFHLEVCFTHKMSRESLENTEAFELDYSPGQPSSAVADTLTFQSVTLSFNDQLAEGQVYHLSFTVPLYDCTGAPVLLHDQYEFPVPRQCLPYEVVITELMADPSPPRGLPVFEYLELYNRTSSWFDLRGWNLIVGTTSKLLPSFILGPGEYLIITIDEASAIFTLFGNAIGLSSLGLSNSGSNISLTDKEGSIICEMFYSDSWYGSSEKVEGGWSLEMIDTDSPCLVEGNWTASVAYEGGTPGSINSVDATMNATLSVNSIHSIDSRKAELTFSERMDTSAICMTSLYEVDRGIGHPVKVYPYNGSSVTVILEFDVDLEKRTFYSLIFTGTVSNCTGEECSITGPAYFGIAEAADAGDLIINEVLFNPWSEGCDFVELYNPSQKIIDMGALMVGSVDHGAFPVADTEFVSISGIRESLMPGEYKVLTTSSEKISMYYQVPAKEVFMEMEKMPALNNDEGTVLLCSPAGVMIDRMHYTEEMQFPLIDNPEGVSLERINPFSPSEEETNWHSASEESGFATPGYRNSQYSEWETVPDPVSVDPEIFSPDNDGYQDVLQILYELEKPGYMGTVLVFDLAGRLVRNLVNNNLLGTEGSFSWDGIMEDRHPASPGIYIIYFEIFDLNGKVKRYKKPAVLALRR